MFCGQCYNQYYSSMSVISSNIDNSDPPAEAGPVEGKGGTVIFRLLAND